MNFYFCFRISFYIKCFIPILTFSNRMSCFGIHTDELIRAILDPFNKYVDFVFDTRQKLNTALLEHLMEVNRPKKVIDYSDECNKAKKDFFIPSNEKLYPFSFFSIQHLLSQFFNISVENGEILFKRKEKIELNQENNMSTLVKIVMPKISDSELILRIVNKFEEIKQYEEQLNNAFLRFQIGHGTVSIDMAKDILKENLLFANSSDVRDHLLKKYTKKKNDQLFNYKKMRENVANDYKGDKSNILTYDNYQNVWKKLNELQSKMI
ncbi:uncharacterized protein LOC126894992 isoform X2 [Daktulosphaira vitifoliae]|uniref:uncharacterized protein LOC126894992 isoform X2 n=1 Tax=Daktulosphaira vitifoliae TaxID=58002 RepID=UPI0021A9C1B0|nr:uncharacterized protein LOC126894992 isoform X2 [Daktulosphaira vitifoliae]